MPFYPLFNRLFGDSLGDLLKKVETVIGPNFKSTFEGAQNQFVLCRSCGKLAKSSQIFTNVFLEVGDFYQQLKKQQLSAPIENRQCDCGAKQSFQTNEITQIPKQLIYTLKRHKFENNKWAKDKKQMKMPLYVDLTFQSYLHQFEHPEAILQPWLYFRCQGETIYQVFKEDFCRIPGFFTHLLKNYNLSRVSEEPSLIGEPEHLYRMSSAICHSGEATRGHYFTVIYRGGKFIKISDASVTQISQQQFEQFGGGDEATGYIYFYEQCGAEFLISKVLSPKIKEKILVDEAEFTRTKMQFTTKVVSNAANPQGKDFKTSIIKAKQSEFVYNYEKSASEFLKECLKQLEVNCQYKYVNLHRVNIFKEPNYCIMENVGECKLTLQQLLQVEEDNPQSEQLFALEFVQETKKEEIIYENTKTMKFKVINIRKFEKFGDIQISSDLALQMGEEQQITVPIKATIKDIRGEIAKTLNKEYHEVHLLRLFNGRLFMLNVLQLKQINKISQDTADYQLGGDILVEVGEPLSYLQVSYEQILDKSPIFGLFQKFDWAMCAVGGEKFMVDRNQSLSAFLKIFGAYQEVKSLKCGAEIDLTKEVPLSELVAKQGVLEVELVLKAKSVSFTGDLVQSFFINPQTQLKQLATGYKVFFANNELEPEQILFDLSPDPVIYLKAKTIPPQVEKQFLLNNQPTTFRDSQTLADFASNTCFLKISPKNFKKINKDHILEEGAEIFEAKSDLEKKFASQAKEAECKMLLLQLEGEHRLFSQSCSVPDFLQQIQEFAKVEKVLYEAEMKNGMKTKSRRTVQENLYKDAWADLTSLGNIFEKVWLFVE